MTILTNCELHYAKLDPRRPNAKFDKERPTWEVQIRTKDKAAKKEWEELGLKVKMEEDDDGNVYYRANLKKRSVKSDGEPADPVRVVDGSLNPIDPNTIGYGSVGNVRIYQYPTKRPDGSIGRATVLMAVQVTELKKYKPKDFEDFEETETTVIEPEETKTLEDDDDDVPY